MYANYETDDTGRLRSVTTYPLDENKDMVALPLDFDDHPLRDYVVRDGEVYLEPVPVAPTNEEQIATLKRRLADTDYVVIKIAEGAATTDEYTDTIKQRAEWRAEINRLEGQECDA